MSRERTLLERLAMAGRPATRSMQEDTAALLHSIMTNLGKVLNVRQGDAPAQMDLGVPPPSEILGGFPESIGRMQHLIKQCIERYEPRLTATRVMYVESDDESMTLRFQITAKLAGDRNQLPVSFQTLLGKSGQISVED
ncbi:type VI secretion system baseplate subunit TssE [Acidimicrobium ferrooxidans]|nr:type VI secretion system baseplate subunit TssE [Acidimicrobium ferrooxidans]